MTTLNSKYPTLVHQYKIIHSSNVAKIMLVISGSLALWISAKISIPFFPIPMTMQTFVVLVIGMSFGWKLAGSTLLLYLSEGALGLPVFSSSPATGIGLSYMFGPTGGYLLGFLVSSMFVGWLAEKGWSKNVFTSFIALLMGTGIIFVFGIVWLATLIGWDQPVFELGVLPFIGGEILKISLASVILPLLMKYNNKS